MTKDQLSHCEACGLQTPCPKCSPPRIGLAPISQEQALRELKTLLTWAVTESWRAAATYQSLQFYAQGKILEEVTLFQTAEQSASRAHAVEGIIERIVAEALTKVPR